MVEGIKWNSKKAKAGLGFYKPGESWVGYVHVLKPIRFLLFL